MKVSYQFFCSFCSSSHTSILELPKGSHWRLTEFITTHRESLQHDFAQLMEAHKSNHVTQLMQESVRKQAIVHDQPKAVQRKMSAAFETMDKEASFTLCSTNLLHSSFDYSGPHCVWASELKGSISQCVGGWKTSVHPKSSSCQRVTNLSTWCWISNLTS